MSAKPDAPTLAGALARLPLVAILRGLPPDDAAPIGAVLHDAGFRILEVPLNSPRPLASIACLVERFGCDCLVGAGTVRTPAQVRDIAAAGGRLIVMPHGDPAVIRAARDAGLACVPGVATPTEAFAAIDAGASALKLFPAEQFAPAVLKAWRAVLDPAVAILPVGGITPASLGPWRAAGATGFGLGSALYRPGQDAATVAAQARAFVDALAAAGARRPPA